MRDRFSGLTAEDLVGVSTTLRDVQAILLSLFSDKTILVGHSLESDAMALKVGKPYTPVVSLDKWHSTVILFENNLGMKRHMKKGKL